MHQVLASLIVLAAVLLLLVAAASKLRRVARREEIPQPSLHLLKKSLIAVALTFIALAELYIFTSHMSFLAALLALLAVVVALSWKVLSLLFAYFVVTLSKHIAPGEYVEINGIRGRVRSVGLFHTTIRTDDDDIVTIPNTKLLEHTVRYIGDERTLILKLHVDIGSLEALKDIEEKIHSALTERFRHASRSGEYELYLEGIESKKATLLLKARYLGLHEREPVINSLLKALTEELEEYAPKIEVVRGG